MPKPYVTDAANKVGPDWSTMRQILGDLRTLLETLSLWKIVQVRREANTASRSLAQLPTQQGLDRSWMGATWHSCLLGKGWIGHVWEPLLIV
jgi:hypothetical protein